MAFDSSHLGRSPDIVHTPGGDMPQWFTPRLPSAEECSLGLLLKQRAQAAPDRIFVKFDDCTVWTQAQAYSQALLAAGRLRHLGVGSGDHLLIWLPNGPDMLRYMLGAWLIGATVVPVNISFKGSILEHVVQKSEAAVMVAHPELVAKLTGLDTGSLRTVLVPGHEAIEPGAVTIGPWTRVDEALIAADADGCECSVIVNEAWHIGAIIFTSGTTGKSKAVKVPLGQLWTLGQTFYGYMTPNDRMLLVLPLFHIAALGALFGAMCAGSSFALTESFKASTFWKTVSSTEATTLPGLGPTLIEMLMKADPAASDTTHTLRTCIVQSASQTALAFSSRFGCDLVCCYNMSEASCIAMSEPGKHRDGSLGKPRRGIEVRIVDGHDVEVKRGEVGEVVLRSALPWTLNAGYHNDFEETVKAWNNGWFHTGDLVRQDEEGYLYFVDRMKDIIRRRSENISSHELELEMRKHPAIRDAAAVGVLTAQGDEVLMAITLIDDAVVGPADLIEFLIERLPHFMVPRFLRILPELPKTQGTNRVKKAVLRAEGVSIDCWDREAAGYRIRREQLTSSGRAPESST
ncbi:AMP-binding protein [Pseudomonas sp. NFX224]|uniref:AMP-binding protein n=1 Tax=Pseudomonas sp. NFX224 TaxID=3402862 RepID=UPI003AFA9BC7